MIFWSGSHPKSETDQVCVDLYAITITVAHSTKNLDGEDP